METQRINRHTGVRLAQSLSRALREADVFYFPFFSEFVKGSDGFLQWSF